VLDMVAADTHSDAILAEVARLHVAALSQATSP
jgi:hypothetical protein